MKTKTAERFRITRRNIEHDSYDVQSPSGNIYVVSYCGSGDADPDYVALWDCTCPAAKFGSDLCKHIKAVLRATEDEYGDPIELEVGQTVEA